MSNDYKYGSEYPAISHLAYWQDKKIDQNTYEILRDFKVFLTEAWLTLGLPEPTQLQYDVADYLQGNENYVDLFSKEYYDIPVEDLSEGTNGSGKIVTGYRGFGKSWVTAIYCIWQILRIPKIEITVTSASDSKSTAFMSFALSVVKMFDFCEFLIPAKGDVNNKYMFDSPTHEPSQANTLAAVALFSNVLTGRRSDIIIADDAEVINNSGSLLQRNRVAERISEFEAVLGDIPDDPKVRFKQKILLGTPQTQETLYMRLLKNGYDLRIWPARYFGAEQFERLGHLLCPRIAKKIKDNLVATKGYGLRGDMGEPTDTRFNDESLTRKELGYGYTGFQLQYQLDPSLSDLAKFPLKLSDLIVADLNQSLGYNMLVYSSDRKDVISDLPNHGFAGDYFKKPQTISEKMSVYERSVLCIDPSSGGAGKDETTYCVAKTINGFICVFKVGGFLEGPQSEKTMDGLAKLAKQYDVDEIVIETNQGLNMFETLLKPALIRAKYNCSISGYRAVGQKEPRIIKTLEPVMNSHRLVFDRSFVANEELPEIEGMKEEVKLQYSLFYQMTHLEATKNCIPKDDRIDVLHMAVQYFAKDIEIDAQTKELEDEIEFVNSFIELPNIVDADTSGLALRMLIKGEVKSVREFLDDYGIGAGGANIMEFEDDDEY